MEALCASTWALLLGTLRNSLRTSHCSLDALGTQSIVIAATNHHELLDSAIWRRPSALKATLNLVLAKRLPASGAREAQR